MRMLDCEQRSPEWFNARRGIPTASDFAEIITPARGELSASADAYIDRLLDDMARPGSNLVTAYTSAHMQKGVELEPQARRAYAFLTGFNVRECGLILRDDGQAGCSPDGLLVNEAGGVFGGVEIKCPDGPTHVGYLRGGVLPVKYRPQVHGGMAISGLSRWDFFSFCPGHRPFLVTVQRDSYTDKVAAAVDAFLARLADAKKTLGIAA